MSNKQYWQQHASGALGAGGTTTFILSGPGRLQKQVITHVSWYNNTTAMTKVQLQKAVGLDTVVVAETIAPAIGQYYWYHHDIVNHGGVLVPVATDEYTLLVLIGTAPGDTIAYYAEGYFESDSAWEGGV